LLRLSKLSDYAIVMLAHLARSAHVCVHPATSIADATSIPLPTVAKILKTLAREGLLISTRGAHGGYGLARDPRTISVVDVLEAMEGPFALTGCSHHGTVACAEEGHCSLPAHWPAINAAVREALGQVTLMQLAGPPERRAALTTPRPQAAQGGTS
jgi:FeS assembly SUF system regulator